MSNPLLDHFQTFLSREFCLGESIRSSYFVFYWIPSENGRHFHVDTIDLVFVRFCFYAREKVADRTVACAVRLLLRFFEAVGLFHYLYLEMETDFMEPIITDMFPTSQ